MKKKTTPPVSWVIGEDTGSRMEAYIRHLVAISWIDSPVKPTPTDNEHRYHIVSGFVISVKEIWIWVTAGHIIEDIEKILSSGRKIEKMKLADNWKQSPIGNGHPFHYGEHFHHIYLPEIGIDYGMVVLRDLYVEYLKANNVIALDESRWAKPPLKLLMCEMFGLPTCLNDVKIEQVGNQRTIKTKSHPWLGRIDGVESPPKTLLKKNHRLYGKLNDNGKISPPLKSIDGMSGAPIYGLALDENQQLSYWPVAVQSGWDESKRVIAGCYLSVLGNAIAKRLNRSTKKKKSPR